MRRSIQEIFQEKGEEYLRTRKLPVRSLQAIRAINKCRTAVLGGHVERCPDGHVAKVWYNSCRHRACPACTFIQRERWVQRRMETMPACDYFHTIFTLPAQLNDLWAFNRRRFTQLLFHASWQTLRELLADPKYLGALPGVLAVFHSWSQTIWTHPHVHLLVTGGGLAPDGTWHRTRQSYLLPGRVVSAKFRGKFLDFLHTALEKGDLLLPPTLNLVRCQALFRQLGRRRWHVRIMPPYQHGRGVVRYLGRYVRGGPISNARVRRIDADRVAVRYKDGTRTQARSLTLANEEFMDRFLEHVPESGMHQVRLFGLFAPGLRAQLNQARTLLGQLPVSPPEELPVEEICARAGLVIAVCCPVCGKHLVRVPWQRSGPSPPCQQIA